MSELQAERRQVHPDEVNSIQAALCDWIGHLPEELQLYNVAGVRNAYYRPAWELAIQYFVAIILSEFLRYREKPKSRQALIPSLLAASCAASLYDEIYCRDESLFLLHIHGFFCLASSLPLIHYVPRSLPNEAHCKRDLGIIRSVLTAISSRYGDGRMSLRMIDDLEKSVERSAHQHGGLETVEDFQPRFDASRLFPFPPSMCDNMDLLKSAAIPEDQFIVNNLGPMPNWPADDASFDFTWMDLFGLDFGDANADFEAIDGLALQ